MGTSVEDAMTFRLFLTAGAVNLDALCSTFFFSSFLFVFVRSGNN